MKNHKLSEIPRYTGTWKRNLPRNYRYIPQRSPFRSFPGTSTAEKSGISEIPVDTGRCGRESWAGRQVFGRYRKIWQGHGRQREIPRKTAVELRLDLTNLPRKVAEIREMAVVSRNPGLFRGNLPRKRPVFRDYREMDILE